MHETNIQTENTPGTPRVGRSSQFRWDQRYTTTIFLACVLFETVGMRWNVLWKIQELDLFVFSRAFLLDSFRQSGGFTLYIGSFFTQFFYHPWLGALMYTLLLWGVSRLTATAFNLKGRLQPFSFIPALAILLTLTELGYVIVDLTVQGYAFAVPIGLTALLTGFLFYRKTTGNYARSGFLFGWTLLAFPLFGAYALAGTLLMLVFTLRQSKPTHDKWVWMPILIGAASLSMLPLLIENILFTESDGIHPFAALLPEFQPKEAHLWLPYILLASSLLVMALALPIRSHDTPVTPVQRFSPLLLLAATLLTVNLSGYKDTSFLTELAMEKAFSTGNWQEVLRLSNRQDGEQSPHATPYTELALYKLDLMEAPTTVTASTLSGAMICYEYGDARSALRWSMKQMALHGTDAYVLKYATLAAHAVGKDKLATKFNQQLKATLFYRQWALEQETLIERSDKSATLQ